MTSARRMGRKNAKLWERPGFLIRRLHQIGVGVFTEGMADLGLTPLQFGALTIIASTPGIEQSAIGENLGIDRVNVGDIIKRLISQGLVTRRVSTHDRRYKNVYLTAAGADAAAAGARKLRGISAKLLKPLNKLEQKNFLELAQKLVAGNNAYGPLFLLPFEELGDHDNSPAIDAGELPQLAEASPD